MKNGLKKFMAILTALLFLIASPGFAETKKKPKDEEPKRNRVKKHTGRHYREARKYERRAKLKAEYDPPPKPRVKYSPTPRPKRYTGGIDPDEVEETKPESYRPRF